MVGAGVDRCTWIQEILIQVENHVAEGLATVFDSCCSRVARIFEDGPNSYGVAVIVVVVVVVVNGFLI